MKPRIEYRVEAETSIGYKGKRGIPYPVFSLYQFARTHKEAIQIARRRRQLEPLFSVRIVRDMRIVTVTKLFTPNTTPDRQEGAR